MSGSGLRSFPHHDVLRYVAHVGRQADAVVAHTDFHRFADIARRDVECRLLTRRFRNTHVTSCGTPSIGVNKSTFSIAITAWEGPAWRNA